MKASVLILDGDRWQRETLAAALAYEGCHAEHTGEVTSAMAVLAQHRFHLVLIDPSAPATGGRETIKRLKLLHPTLPVIVLRSAEAEPHSSAMTGQTDVIEKPIDFTALLHAIGRALSTPAEIATTRDGERGAASTCHAPDAIDTPAIK